MSGRRFRAVLVLAGVLAALALGAVAAGRARPRLERAIAARLAGAAARRGLRAQVASVHVGVWPPLALRGVRVDTAGGWSVTADRVDVWLRLRGRGLLGRTRLAVGRLRAAGAGGLEAEVGPSTWDVTDASPDSLRVELREPAAGLTVAWRRGDGGGRLDVRAVDLPAGRLLAVGRNGTPLVDAGVVSGRLELSAGPGLTRIDLHLAGRSVRLAALSGDAPADAPPFGQPTDVALQVSGSWQPREGALLVPRWDARVDGAALSGSLSVTGVGSDPAVDVSMDLERVDFARLFRTSGLVRPQAVALPVDRMDGAGDLGSASLSAHANGRLADPGSFVVTQRLDFAPPARIPPALARLRADFTDEVALPGGGVKRIDVSPASPDFIALADVPPLFVRTLLIAEDAGFWGHPGIDLSELPSALLTNWARGGAVRGASTITQQLAKNLFLSRERRLGRKLQELSLALLLEAALGKPRILEIYLNVIEWGPGLYGLRPAARHYFHAEPADLTPAQMAFLVALIPGPVKYQRSLAGGTVSRGFRPLVDELLAKLRSVDALSEEEYQAALAEPLEVAGSGPEPAG